MATDAVGICNSALSQLGDTTILSLSDTSVVAKLCNRYYAESRDECLSLNPWNFAKTRATLQQNVTAPNWGYDYAYTLPSDCIQVTKMKDDDLYEYKIEGRNLVTDASTVKILYVAQITDVGNMPAWFKRLVTAHLAHKLAMPITNSGSVMDRMYQKYKDAEMDAFSADAQEGTQETLQYDDLINYR